MSLGYLAGGWAMAPEAAALWSSGPQFAGFVGAVGGGWLADRLARRLGEQTARRRLLVAGLLAAGAGSAGAAVAGSAWLALGSIAAALFCPDLATTAGWALAGSLAPVALVATVEAMANIGGSVGGLLATLLTECWPRRQARSRPRCGSPPGWLRCAPELRDGWREHQFCRIRTRSKAASSRPTRLSHRPSCR